MQSFGAHSQLTLDVVHSLGLKASRGVYSGPCPCCGYPTGFSMRENQGKILAYCHAGGCSFRELLAAIRAVTPWTRLPQLQPEPTIAVPNSYNKQKQALKIWEQARPSNDSPVEAYLHHRGISGPIPDALRYHPNCLHTPSGQYYPAMIAKVTAFESTTLLAVHRTYLTADGQSKIGNAQAKMMLGSVIGNSVHLGEPHAVLAVAEGIETALSVQQATGIPTWAALSWGGLKNLILPPLPVASEVIICADNDPCGLEGAMLAGERWVQEGRQVRLAKPTIPKTDFNDLLQEKVSQ